MLIKVDKKIAMLIANEYGISYKSIEKEIKHCNWLHTQHGKYYNENKKTISEYNKKYYSTEKWKEYFREHKEYGKVYYKTHKEQINKYERERRRKNPQYRLSNNISRAIRQSLKDGKNGRHWEFVLGYTVNDLISQLKSKFKYGMTLENYGKIWEIDHIIPISWFDYNSTDDYEFKQAWRLENLQSKLIDENRIKHNCFADNGGQLEFLI